MKKNGLNKLKRHQETAARHHMKRRKRKFYSRHSKQFYSARPYPYQSTLVSKSQGAYLPERSRYSKFAMNRVLTSDDIFPSEKIDIKEILAGFSREDVIKLVFTLNRLYKNANVEMLDCFFSSSNQVYKDEIAKRLSTVLSTDPCVQYLFTTFQTSIELLRYGFSIPAQYNSKYGSSDFEYQGLKAILAANKNVVDFKISINDLPAMLYINSASNKYINQADFRTHFITQLYMSYRFFSFVSKEQRYKPMYDKFLERYHISRWQDYVLTIVSFAFMCLWLDGLISKAMIPEISRPFDAELKYSSDSTIDKEGNSDYRLFKEKPIIKMPNGDYVVLNVNFLLDKLYGGLYFDFKDIAQSLGKVGFDTEYTSDFIEKSVFDGLLEKASNKTRYNSNSEITCYDNHKPDQREIGPPDYVLTTKTSILLFECKDVRINGWILEQRDYDLLIDELKNKLLIKKWKYKNGEKKFFEIDKQQPIGIGQLAKNVQNIVKGDFMYCDVPAESFIYCVLVLVDHRYVTDGFNVIADRWYNKLVNDGSGRVMPLIVMSLTTLVKYHKLFYQKGFECFFDGYVRQTQFLVKNELDLANSCISFDDYMSQFPFNLADEHNMIMIELIGKDRYNNMIATRRINS